MINLYTNRISTNIDGLVRSPSIGRGWFSPVLGWGWYQANSLHSFGKLRMVSLSNHWRGSHASGVITCRGKSAKATFHEGINYNPKALLTGFLSWIKSKNIILESLRSVVLFLA